jgi:hypothetical protein
MSLPRKANHAVAVLAGHDVEAGDASAPTVMCAPTPTLTLLSPRLCGALVGFPHREHLGPGAPLALVAQGCPDGQARRLPRSAYARH